MESRRSTLKRAINISLIAFVMYYILKWVEHIPYGFQQGTSFVSYGNENNYIFHIIFLITLSYTYLRLQVLYPKKQLLWTIIFLLPIIIPKVLPHDVSEGLFYLNFFVFFILFLSIATDDKSLRDNKRQNYLIAICCIFFTALDYLLSKVTDISLYSSDDYYLKDTCLCYLLSGSSFLYLRYYKKINVKIRSLIVIALLYLPLIFTALCYPSIEQERLLQQYSVLVVISLFSIFVLLRDRCDILTIESTVAISIVSGILILVLSILYLVEFFNHTLTTSWSTDRIYLITLLLPLVLSGITKGKVVGRIFYSLCTLVALVCIIISGSRTAPITWIWTRWIPCALYGVSG